MLVVPRPPLSKGIVVPLMIALSVPEPARDRALVSIVMLPSSSASGVKPLDPGAKPNCTPELTVYLLPAMVKSPLTVTNSRPPAVTEFNWPRVVNVNAGAV